MESESDSRNYSPEALCWITLEQEEEKNFFKHYVLDSCEELYHIQMEIYDIGDADSE